MITPPIAIAVTLSQQTIADRKGGFKTILEEWNNPDIIWYYRCGNLPKFTELLYVFWVIGGRYRYVSVIAGMEKDKTMRFVRENGTFAEMHGNWILNIDYKPIPRRYQEPRKGFQGFRYIQEEDMPWDPKLTV